MKPQAANNKLQLCVSELYFVLVNSVVNNWKISRPGRISNLEATQYTVCPSQPAYMLKVHLHLRSIYKADRIYEPEK